MSKPRRLVVMCADNSVLAQDHDHYLINLTGVQNANCQTPVKAVVQEQCEFGCWHDRSAYPLQPWGPE